jgi:hypothetical protein
MASLAALLEWLGIRCLVTTVARRCALDRETEAAERGYFCLTTVHETDGELLDVGGRKRFGQVEDR